MSFGFFFFLFPLVSSINIAAKLKYKGTERKGDRKRQKRTT
jgi:hypothetical protein